MDVRSRIIEASADLVSEVGFTGLTISAAARAAGVSRPTVYAHFGTLEDLASGVMKFGSARVISRIIDKAKGASTAADFVVETLIAARTEFRNEPLLAPFVSPERTPVGYDRDDIAGARAVEMARSFLEPLLGYAPERVADLDEIAEMMLRLVGSFVLFESEMSRSDERLRSYLHRRVIPGFGLEAS